MKRTYILAEDSSDSLVERETERQFEILVKEMKNSENGGKSDAEIASKLVYDWMLKHSYIITDSKEKTCCIIGGIEAAGLGKDKSEQYQDANYWAPYFADTTSSYSETFWNELFTCKEGEFQYKESLVSSLIPDDPIHRFVLHFLRDWKTRLHDYIVDVQICVDERALVLRKQVENFAFFSRKKPFGRKWKMYSEPNDLVRQALEAAGMPVAVRDAQGNPLRGIQGEHVFYQAAENIPKTAADGPRPDDQDRKIYDYI